MQENYVNGGVNPFPAHPHTHPRVGGGVGVEDFSVTNLQKFLENDNLYDLDNKELDRYLPNRQSQPNDDVARVVRLSYSSCAAHVNGQNISPLSNSDSGMGSGEAPRSARSSSFSSPDAIFDLDRQVSVINTYPSRA
jgi:hypothetical protein